jgi:hypothetical protein
LIGWIKVDGKIGRWVDEGYCKLTDRREQLISDRLIISQEVLTRQG